MRQRFLAGAGGLWLLLLIPSTPLSQHQCFPFIGFLAHSPLYAFLALDGRSYRLGRRLRAPSPPLEVRP